MPPSPLEITQDFLSKAFDPALVADAADRLVAEDAEYVSLNFDNPPLQRLMPWAGASKGRQAFVYTFTNVMTRWNLEGFEYTDTLGDDRGAAVFGTFTLRSVRLGKAATSPFAVVSRVHDGRITYMQYMEDTFATALTFRSGGAWTIEADPDTDERIEV
ncbi:nuclear transport factor 2 family protein [Streptomyces katsurahamanus]|uniref:Nuclear transport factor 2 family protein n=1 Tax=Streptomyces katsurahamanus TaxID=2577098 RepID=A0ABW9NXH6_9ACTN|nr:nuclear transport factor 2 family protein [Streptomyces katsurahamanus]MQS38003.1 nuclear transport factor 2 family protein [Streptomyces katsurahamanus]